MITPEVIAQHNLTLDEFNRIKELLGREPNLVELGVFSVMWSEHCSYKSSRVHLKRLPTSGERVIVPPGENAGIVDFGDGWRADHRRRSRLRRRLRLESSRQCIRVGLGAQRSNLFRQSYRRGQSRVICWRKNWSRWNSRRDNGFSGI